jgi:hypothetical protein
MWKFLASVRVCPCRSRFIGKKNTAAKGHTSSQHNDDNCEWEVISIPPASEGHGLGAEKQDAEDTKPGVTLASTEKTKVADSKADLDRQPCLGEHVPVRRANQHASWTTCARCSLRLSYDPVRKQTSQDPMAEVAETVSQLRVQCQAVSATAELLSTNLSNVRNEQGTSRKKKA